MGEICYHMKEPAVKVLGPGVRYVLWVQGCEKRCPGCIAPDSRRMEDGKLISTGALALEIALSGADGLTISGGEPFLQAKELAVMIRKVRAIRPMGVIVYTGYHYEELRASPEKSQLLDEIDLLIDGEYIEALNDGKGLRGSSNQRVIALTGLYRDIAEEYAEMPREQQVFYHGSEIHAAGIPDSSGKYHFERKGSEIK